jgi:hypothetical protein
MLAQTAIAAVMLAARRLISRAIAMPFPSRGTHRNNQPLRDSDLLFDRSVRQYIGIVPETSRTRGQAEWKKLAVIVGNDR